MFFGSLEKYHFENKGKREIYMGHNAYKLGAAGVSPDDIIQVGSDILRVIQELLKGILAGIVKRLATGLVQHHLCHGGVHLFGELRGFF